MLTQSAEDQSLEEFGRLAVDRLLGNTSAFNFRQVLDRRGFRIGGPEVFEVVYYSDEVDMPRGFNYWPEDFECNRLAENPGWVETPQNGEVMALKARSLEDQIINERRALLKSNELFPISSPSRPQRLYGFGIGEGEFFGKPVAKGYLLMELLPPGFVSYENFITPRDTLPLSEGFALVLSLAEIINVMHKAGIAHGDLEGPGHLEHVYWNPIDKQLRIIDWSHSDNAAANPSVVHLDQIGLMQVVGDVMELGAADPASKNRYLEMKEGIDIDFINDYEINPKQEGMTYPPTADSTSRLLQDLYDLIEMSLK